MSKLVVTFVCFLILEFALSNKVYTNLNNVLYSGDYEFIDLSNPFDNLTVYWPDSQNFVFTKVVTEEKVDDGSWYAANDFAAGEHGGTHIDAPYHFNKLGLHVGEISLEKLIIPLIIVDISSKVNNDPNFVLHKSDMDYLFNDNMGKPCLVIFKFGWTKYYSDRKKYLGINDNNKSLNFPGLSSEVAEWISSYNNVVGVGVDVASLDPGKSTNFTVHKIISKAGLYGIENVKLDRSLPDYGCTAIVLPMKIAKGTGAPLRLVAICPKKIPTQF